jgi:hypothetical protein
MLIGVTINDIQIMSFICQFSDTLVSHRKDTVFRPREYFQSVASSQKYSPYVPFPAHRKPILTGTCFPALLSLCTVIIKGYEHSVGEKQTDQKFGPNKIKVCFRFDGRVPQEWRYMLRMERFVDELNGELQKTMRKGTFSIYPRYILLITQLLKLHIKDKSNGVLPEAVAQGDEKAHGLPALDISESDQLGFLHKRRYQQKGTFHEEKKKNSNFNSNVAHDASGIGSCRNIKSRSRMARL